MICNPCQKTDNPPLCLTNLVLGAIPNLSTAVHVYQKHIGSGRTVRYDVTTDGAGLVTIAPQSLMAGQQYEYTVTLTTNLEPIDVTIDGTAYPCLNVEYDKINDATTGNSETYATVTLTV